MSVITVHSGSPIAIGHQLASLDDTAKTGALVTLADLLDILRADEPPAYPMLKTTASLLCSFFARPATDLELGTITLGLPSFRKFLESRKYKRNSVRSYLNHARVLIRLAEEHGWVQTQLVPQSWSEVYELSKQRGCSKLVLSLSQARRSPREVQPEDVERWGQQRFSEGVRYTTQQVQAKRFWKLLQELNCLGVDSRKVLRPERVGIPLRNFPPNLKFEIEALRKWKTAPFAMDRPKGARVRNVTAVGVEKILQMIYGYAVNVLGADGITSLDRLVTNEIIGGFIEFSLSERQVKGYPLAGRLGCLLAAIRQFPRYRATDWSWFKGMVDNIPLETDSERRSRKAQKFLDYDELALIPAKLRAMRSAAEKKGPRALAMNVMSELLIRWLLILPWRQRNVRECRICGSKPNLFRSRIPAFSAVEKPAWVQRQEQTDPQSEFWMIQFSASETKTGNEPNLFLPHRLIELVDEYIRDFRPLLVQGKQCDTLFTNGAGNPLSPNELMRLISDITLRYGGRRVTPHLFRDSFAYKWLREHPKDFLTVSKALWHSNINTTLKIYGARFNESSATCAVEAWLDDREATSTS